MKVYKSITFESGKKNKNEINYCTRKETNVANVFFILCVKRSLRSSSLKKLTIFIYLWRKITLEMLQVVKKTLFKNLETRRKFNEIKFICNT
jgi:hypothetical protein